MPSVSVAGENDPFRRLPCLCLKDRESWRVFESFAWWSDSKQPGQSGKALPRVVSVKRTATRGGLLIAKHDEAPDERRRR